MAEISKIQLPDGTSYDIQDKTSGYITGYTETDPIFSASPAAGITAVDIVNWNSSSSLPSQTGNAGKFLTTDGTDASWATVSSGDQTYQGEITASTDLSTLTAGVWGVTNIINADFPDPTASFYGYLIQYNNTYKNQLLVAGVADESNIYHRRYLTDSSAFTPWGKLAKNLDDLEDVFVAESSSTSYNDINEAYEAGNILILLSSGAAYMLRELDPENSFIFQNGQNVIEIADDNTKSYYTIDIYTTRATNSTSKLFLVGATSQTPSPQTYSNSNVYETNGVLNATSYMINAAANIVYDSTTKSIDFTFN